MSETKGLTISIKNIAVWVMLVILVVAQITTYTLLKDQVRRNTDQLEANPPAVFAIEQKNMANDVQEIKGDVKKLVETFTNYMLTHQ